MPYLIKVATIDIVLSLHRRGWSQRRIANELDINRETVARYLKQAESAPKPANAPSGSGTLESAPKPANAPSGSGTLEPAPKPANAPTGSDTLESELEPNPPPLASAPPSVDQG